MLETAVNTVLVEAMNKEALQSSVMGERHKGRAVVLFVDLRLLLSVVLTDPSFNHLLVGK